MNNRLNEIVAVKKLEVSQLQKEYKVSDLEATSYFNRKGMSLKKRLLKTPGLITEFKRASPSEGAINQEAKVQSIVRGYDKAGAAAISILTDKQFFGGSTSDLVQARQITDIPILRKDFIIDEIQVYQAKSVGADIILLIAEILEKDQAKALAQLAKEIQLEVLFEVHSPEQLEKLNEYVDFVGVNNRDLTTFTVDIQQSIDMAKLVPSDFIKISESGYTQAEEVLSVLHHGYRGFLIGSHFMRYEDPAAAVERMLSSLSGSKHEK